MFPLIFKLFSLYFLSPLLFAEYSMIYAVPETPKGTLPKGKALFAHYAETDVVNIQGVSGNTIYGVPSQCMEKLNNSRSPCPEYPRHKLKFLEILGEGMFGEVSCWIILVLLKVL